MITISDTLETAIDILGIPTFDLGNDTTICEGEVLLFNAEVANAQYFGNTGEITQSINVSEGGLCKVRVSNSCFSSSDSTYVNVIPKLDFIQKEIIACDEATVILNAGNINVSCPEIALHSV